MIHVAWKHRVSVVGYTRKIKCKYCERMFTRKGFIILFEAKFGRNNQRCRSLRLVPKDVQKEMLDIVSSLHEKLIKKNQMSIKDLCVVILTKKQKRITDLLLKLGLRHNA